MAIIRNTAGPLGRFRRTPGIHRIAAAGNAAALVVLVLALANGRAIFETHGSTESKSETLTAVEPLTAGPARGLILVVVDGLRADTATDPALMPALTALGRAGGSGTARVECLVPSTVAAVVTLATGRVPPPASFFRDFGARPERSGGVFEAVAQSGGRSFVAGPALWVDLFGPWIDGAAVVKAFGPRDPSTLDAGLAAIRSGAYRLVVVHLQQADEAAHRDGTESRRYADAARWCDDAVRRLDAARPPGYALLVTSDHGNIRAGGHAGPEPQVVITPLVTLGPGLPHGRLPELRQREIAGLVLHALGVSAARSSTRISAEDWGWTKVRVVLAAVVAVGSAAWLWIGVAGRSRGARQAFWLNLAVWGVLILVMAGRDRAAMALGLAALAASAWMTGPIGVSRGVIAALALGAGVGTLRLLGAWNDGQNDATAPLPLFIAALAPAALLARGWPDRQTCRIVVGAAALGLVVQGPILAAVVVVAALLGRWLAVRTGSNRLAAIGILCGISPGLWNLLLGKSLSLSTIDVRTAYRLVDLPFGLGLAALAVVVADALPLAALLIGLRPLLRRLGPTGLARVASPMAAVLAAQAVPMALTLAFTGSNSPSTLAALPVSGLLRVFCELIYLFLMLAGWVLADSFGTRKSETGGTLRAESRPI